MDLQMITYLTHLNNCYYKSKNIIISWKKTIKTIEKILDKKYKRKANVVRYDNIVKTLKYDFSLKNSVVHKPPNPVHLTINHILYMNENIYITEKADGIKKEFDITNIYPKIDFFDFSDMFGVYKIYGEEMVIDGTKIIFVFGDQHVINYLRNYHYYIDNTISDNFLIDDKIYSNTEILLLHSYISKNKNKSKNLWWPKKVWSLSKEMFIQKYSVIKEKC